MTENELRAALESSTQKLLGKSISSELFSEKIPFDANQKIDGRQALFHFVERMGMAISGKYDDLTANGLLIRAGREFFNESRWKSKELNAMGEIKKRLKPIDQRFTTSLDQLTRWVSDQFQIKTTFQKADLLHYTINLTPYSEQIAYFPYFLFGFTEEFCYWLDARKTYKLAYNYSKNTGEYGIDLLIQEMA